MCAPRKDALSFRKQYKMNTKVHDEELNPLRESIRETIQETSERFSRAYKTEGLRQRDR
jgi:hypothetical protein